ncbi:proteasome subunit alpha type-3-like [Carcharodon carcharias]|uniref:proteasome subunit alpha type-3-like n=1 Tax=Carcharodon carcharias TaxID=13397 RepID=UPI001B7DCAC8|nr:proteasome subunit alpha type-3-like [Carcharodon carcharias]
MRPEGRQEPESPSSKIRKGSPKSYISRNFLAIDKVILLINQYSKLHHGNLVNRNLNKVKETTEGLPRGVQKEDEQPAVVVDVGLNDIGRKRDVEFRELKFSPYSAERPFGSSFIMGSYGKDNGAQMYVIDPSAVLHGYWGCAIGKAKEEANTEIEKLQMKDMTCREVFKEAAKIIYIVHGEVKAKSFELELSWVEEITKGRHELVPKDIKGAPEKYAKESLEQDGESDEGNM